VGLTVQTLHCFSASHGCLCLKAGWRALPLSILNINFLSCPLLSLLPSPMALPSRSSPGYYLVTPYTSAPILPTSLHFLPSGLQPDASPAKKKLMTSRFFHDERQGTVMDRDTRRSFGMALQTIHPTLLCFAKSLTLRKTSKKIPPPYQKICMKSIGEAAAISM
jgi:hypothetical protein